MEFVAQLLKAVAPVKAVLHLLQALSKPLQARQGLRAARAARAEGTGDDPTHSSSKSCEPNTGRRPCLSLRRLNSNVGRHEGVSSARPRFSLVSDVRARCVCSMLVF